MGDNKFAGIEIGGTKLQIVAGSGPSNITRRWRATVRPADGGPGIQRQLTQGLAELADCRTTGAIRAVGVGFGGPIDRKTGRIYRSHQIDGWEQFNLAGWLASILPDAKTPVVVENDANTAALGEALHGAGIGADPVFYVTLGSGVGGGLVAGGQIYHGAIPGEAEFGHLCLGKQGAIVESRCSGWAIDARVRKLALPGGSAFFGKVVAAQGQPGGEARHLPLALAAGDPEATKLLDELGADLAFALSHVVHLFHPEVIVLGGGLSLIGEPLRSAVLAALPEFVMESFRPGAQIRLAKLGEDAVPVGALELARHALP